jgi:DNA-binding NarL/FixJ family response regulator
MQTAREWLARTETRLDEISKQSQDQLKLLGDLLKEDNPVKKTKGAPPIGIRENVVKLAHQGWKVDEIARALHLSRGEVELILELPQN